MRIADALRESPLPREEAETLLAHLLRCDRAGLIAHAHTVIGQADVIALAAMVQRRSRGEPLAYIFGTRDFYGRTFAVDRRAHIPRPSTENLVSFLLDVLAGSWDRMRLLEASDIVGIAVLRGDIHDVRTIVDVGTGSGCIAVTLASERPDLRVVATDISGDALSLARENAERYAIADRIEFREGNLLDPIAGLSEPFLVVSNPPYIPDDRVLPEDVAAWEPATALRGGPEGTDVIRALLSACERHPLCRGCILECERWQADQVHGTLGP